MNTIAGVDNSRARHSLACPKDPAPMWLSSLSKEPLVSVVVANYNYGRFLPDAAQSVMDQTYSNWELIICDDGSTDASLKIAQKLACRDSRIKVLAKENGGQASAWNYAVEHSNGEILALLDADDLFRSDKLELVVQTFQEQPRVGLVYHQLQFVDAMGNRKRVPFPEHLPEGWLFETAVDRGGVAFPGSALMALHREFADAVFPIPESLMFGDAYLSMVAATITHVAAIKHPLSFYRLHTSNHSAQANVDLADLAAIDRWITIFLEAQEHYRRFLAAYYGVKFADRIKVSDLPVLESALPRSYVLRDKPPDGVHGFSREEILALITPQRRQWVWRAMFALPSFMSRRLLIVMASETLPMRTVRAVLRKVGVR
jgi:glycosyltransferase involved in cell wall biosynthesis